MSYYSLRGLCMKMNLFILQIGIQFCKMKEGFAAVRYHGAGL